MKGIGLGLAAAGLLGGAAVAQDVETSADVDAALDDARPMEEMTVTGRLSRFGATKSATPILETARSVSIEMEQQFRDKGALTLDDTLSYISAVAGDTFGFSTRGDFPKVRGLDAAEYRDGLQVLFGFYNNTRSDVYMLEQVEVLKGPASVLYGKGAPGGIVNAISKLAGPAMVDGRVSGEIVADVGNHDRYQVAGDINAALGDRVFVRAVGLFRDADTQVDFVQDDALIFMPSITYATDRTSLTAMVEVVDRDSDTAHQFLPLTGTFFDAPGGQTIEPSTYLGDPDFNRYDTNSVTVSLLGSHVFTDALSIEGIARYKDGEADYRQTWMAFLGAGVPRIDADGNGPRTWYASQASSEQYAIDLRGRWAFDVSFMEHEVFVGFGYQDVTTDNDTIIIRQVGVLNAFDPVYGDIPAVFTDTTPLNDGPESQTRDLGFYLNDQVAIGNWKINFGVRYDEVETERTGGGLAGGRQKDDAVSFSAGLLYAFDFGLSPYFSYAESFEPVIGVNSVTGDFLKPRRGQQFEAGLKYQPPGTRTYVTLAFFDIEESNLPNPASLITDPDRQQEGVGKVQGVELEAQTTIGDWYLEANVSLLDTQTPDGVPFASIPEEQVSAWVQYQPVDGPLAGLRAGAGIRYAGGNESNGLSPTGEPVRIVTDGYTVGDLLLGYATEVWDITLNIRNITGEDYFGTCLARGDCFPGEQRTIVGRVARRF